MKETKGRADGGEVNRLIKEKLGQPGSLPYSALCDTLLQSATVSVMAWNVVIAGGGFGGAMAARELERIIPKQSARLTLVNDVNFMLYTPFLPEAAAGTLEPRHVVTPLREILKRTYLRLGTIDGHDPAAARCGCAAATARPRSCPTTSCCSPSARSRGCCRSRA